MAEEVGNLKATVSLTTVEFNKGVAVMSKQMAIMTQDFRNASAGLDKVGDASKLSALKITELTGKIDGQKKIVREFAEAHKYAAEKFGEGSKQALDYELKLKKAEGTLQGMERQLAQTTEQLRIQSSQWTLLGNNMNNISAKAVELGAKMTSVGKSLSMSVTAPILAAGAASVKMASDYNESLNKVDVAFKGSAEGVKTWAGTTLQSFGIAKGTALDMAAKFGDMSTSMGMNTDQAAAMSTKMVGLAGDLASFKNISIDIANTALTGVFTGETESLKQLGIVMTQANLQEYALSQGIKTKIQDMSQAEQVQLRYNYILANTTNAQLDFSRTSSGTANQMRIFGETMKELGANIGQYILPVITPLIAKLSEMAQKFGALSPQTQKLILVIAGIAAALGPAVLIVGTLVTAFGAIAGAVGAASTAIAVAGGIMAVITGPIGIAIAAVAALVGAGVLLYENWDNIKKKAGELLQTIAPVWAGIKAAVADAWTYIGPAINVAVNEISAFWNEIWPQVQQVFEAVWNAMKVFIAPVMAVIYIAISAALGLIEGIWGNAWNLIKDTLKIVWDAMTGVIKIAWDVISGVIKVGLDLLTGNWGRAWANLKGIFVNTWNDIRGLFVILIADALQYGKDFVQGIIDGITESIDGVEDAVSALAAKIRSYLHFSTPDIGPLVDYETWMPDFMSGLAKGIEANKYMVTNAISGLAGNMQLNASLSGVNGPSYSTVNHNGGNITINVNGTGNQLETTLRRLGVKF